MKLTLDRDQLQTALNQDEEFRLQARYWDGALQLQFGDQVHVLRIADGAVTDVDDTALAEDEPCTVIISAPVADWSELLAPIPRPFYQEFYPASWHHGFELRGDPDYVWPYYAALRRAGEILRDVVSIQED